MHIISKLKINLFALSYIIGFQGSLRNLHICYLEHWSTLVTVTLLDVFFSWFKLRNRSSNILKGSLQSTMTFKYFYLVTMEVKTTDLLFLGKKWPTDSHATDCSSKFIVVEILLSKLFHAYLHVFMWSHIYSTQRSRLWIASYLLTLELKWILNCLQERNVSLSCLNPNIWPIATIFKKFIMLFDVPAHSR